MTQQYPHILGLCGSLRKNSNSQAVLATIGELLKDKASFSTLQLDQVPLYNQDLDTPEPPEGVVHLREAIAQADGIVIATPEYNYGLPGVVKNALDWASRPYGKAHLTGKTVLSVASSPAFTGGVRALAQLNETLLAIGAYPIPGPQVVIASVHEKIQEGRLTDLATQTFVTHSLELLLKEIARR